MIGIIATFGVTRLQTDIFSLSYEQVVHIMLFLPSCVCFSFYIWLVIISYKDMMNPLESVEYISRGCYRVWGHYIIYTHMINGKEEIDENSLYGDPDTCRRIRSLLYDHIGSSRACHLLLLETLGDYSIVNVG